MKRDRLDGERMDPLPSSSCTRCGKPAPVLFIRRAGRPTCVDCLEQPDDDPESDDQRVRFVEPDWPL